MIAASKEYIRRDREDKVEIFAAAEIDDQNHHFLFKYSDLIISSRAIDARTIWKEKGTETTIERG